MKALVIYYANTVTVPNHNFWEWTFRVHTKHYPRIFARMYVLLLTIGNFSFNRAQLSQTSKVPVS